MHMKIRKLLYSMTEQVAQRCSQSLLADNSECMDSSHEYASDNETASDAIDFGTTTATALVDIN